jgi:iron complex outermembrane receptor protein
MPSSRLHTLPFKLRNWLIKMNSLMRSRRTALAWLCALVAEQTCEQQARRSRIKQLLLIALSVTGLNTAHAAESSTLDLHSLSLKELGDVEVTSVSRHAQPIAQAPSSVYVISHEAIVRSGATSIGEMLRLAPNVQVQQLSASRYVISVHGLSGNSQAQSFSNKLLVLVDGRSVYSPLFSGVYWDMSTVVPEDVDRIEVISGPGSTLWGANAVNGVVNIIMRASSETLGGVAALGAGNQQRRASVRYGAQLNDELSGRVYALGFKDDETVTQSNVGAQDNWSNKQAGFRLDLTPASGSLMSLQGDAYTGSENRAANTDEDIAGSNLLARWTRKGARGAELRVQAYHDHIERDTGIDGRFYVETWDLDLQHSFHSGRHELVSGGGYRFNRYQITSNGGLAFAPAGQGLNLVNVFIQDTLSLGTTLRLTTGLKIEDQSYAKAALLPTLRLGWDVTSTTLLWAAASRAIRSSTPFDRDVVETLGTTKFLIGDKNFNAEKLTAYETGIRVQPQPNLRVSAAMFYNDYDQLRSIEVAPAGFLPLRWGNEMQGYTYGADLWAEYQATTNWRLTGAYSSLTERLKFKPGSSALLGVAQAGNDPKSQASLTSSSMLFNKLTVDMTLRYISPLPDPPLPSYTELNARLAWQVKPNLELSVVGRNLLHRDHQEYAGSEANLMVRDVLANIQWTF